MKKLILLGVAALTLSFTTSNMMTGSFYHDKYNGRKTANGSVFSQSKLTAASNIHPLGSTLKVTNIKNNKSVEVKVIDRLHKKYSHRIDLSKKAFKEIADLKEGLVKIKVEKL